MTSSSHELAEVADGSVVLPRAARRHVEQCLRCQAELVQYRKILRAMRSCGPRSSSRLPGWSPRSWPTSRRRVSGRPIRSILGNHKIAYLGGLAAATAATAAGAIIVAGAVAVGAGFVWLPEAG